MPSHISVSNISNYVGQDIILKGWVYNRTDKGKLAFLLVRDGSGFVQCVAFKGDLQPETFDMITRLPQESSVIITGSVREDKRAPGIPGGYEVGIKDLQVVQAADIDYPMALKDHGVDFALDNRHLWIRMQSQWAILRVRVRVMSAVREYLDSHGFFNLDTPILTPAAAEGTTTLFETEYFDEGSAYLAQTGQLYNEANIFAFGKVYCFGPTFRAEKSKTRRHLTEFWMLEPEIAFCDLDGLMEVEEGLITHIVQAVMKDCSAELKFLGRDISKLENVVGPFPRMSYDDAAKYLIELYEKETDPEKKELLKFEWGMDFGAPHETELTKLNEKPLFVYGYPSAVKAFYMEPWLNRPEVCKSVDLLAPEGYGEICGGSERMSDHDALLARIKKRRFARRGFQMVFGIA
ncbi:MAG: asparaginyl-tRNA synthetase [Chloroflexi bacterium OLB14]|nr:MAG: asparaginyl-tRNA synthetase [Chloroflexi bacterium OLB14]